MQRVGAVCRCGAQVRSVDAGHRCGAWVRSEGVEHKGVEHRCWEHMAVGVDMQVKGLSFIVGGDGGWLWVVVGGGGR